MKKFLVGVVLSLAAFGFAATQADVISSYATAKGIDVSGLSTQQILQRMIDRGMVDASWSAKFTNPGAQMSLDDFLLFSADVRNGTAPVPASVDAAKAVLTAAGVDVSKITGSDASAVTAVVTSNPPGNTVNQAANDPATTQKP